MFTILIVDNLMVRIANLNPCCLNTRSGFQQNFDNYLDRQNVAVTQFYRGILELST